MSSPFLDASYSPYLIPIAEGVGNPSGMNIASLLADGSITDADGAVEAIAIEALDTSLGTWQFLLEGSSTWMTIDVSLLNSSTNMLALLLGPNDAIRLLPFGELSGSVPAAITFRAWDRSSGSAGQYVVTSPGAGAFSADSDTAALTVTAVNDAPTFAPVAGSGTLTLALGTGASHARSVVVQPDGRMIVAGYAANGPNGNDFALVRLNPDGSRDTSFGDQGTCLLTLSSSWDSAYSVVVQPDGKILLGGTGYSSSRGDDFAVIRLNADGSVDTSFGDDGARLIPVSLSDIAFSIALQQDGRVLVAGPASNGLEDFAVARLTADGSLDPSFGVGGTLRLPISSSHDRAQTVLSQPDGKIILSGYAFNPTTGDQFVLARLNTDGSVDTAFGDAGVLISGVQGQAQSAAIQADGKIVVAGYNTNYDFVLARFNADGTPDSSFSSDGMQIVPVGSYWDLGYSVAIQADGKIVVAGYAGIGFTDTDFAVIRLNVDGSLDSTFGDDGKRLLPIGQGVDLAYSVFVQPDGRIVVAGSAADPVNGYEFALARLNPDGSLDTTFNGTATSTLGGTVSYVQGASPVDLDTSVSVYDIELAALASGAGDYGRASITLARQGGASPDDRFSATGSLAFVSGSAVLGGVTVGTVSNAGGTLAIAFASATTQAQVDAVLSSIAYANVSASPPSSVVIAWSFSDGNAGAQGSGGALSTSGTTTVTISPPPNATPTLDASFTPAPLVVDEGTTDPVGMTVAALVADGSIADADGALEAIAIEALDASLGTWQYRLDATSTWLTVDTALLNNTTNRLALLLGPNDAIRLLPFGDLNGSVPEAITFRAWDRSSGAAGQYIVTSPGSGAFSSDSDTASLTVSAVNDSPTFAPPTGTGTLLLPIGSSTDEAYGIVVQPDGKIVLAGYGYDYSSGYPFPDFALARLNPDGSLDTGFGSGGKRLLTISPGIEDAQGVVLQADGKILVAGYAYDAANRTSDFALGRLNPDGSLDTTFGSGGTLRLPIVPSDDLAQGVTVQPDGKIVVAGYAYDTAAGSSDFALARLNTDGSLDVTFGSDGTHVLPGAGMQEAQSVVLQSDGKLVVAGYSDDPATGNAAVALARLNPDGSVDTTFGTGGTRLLPIGSGSSAAYSVVVQPDGRIVVGGVAVNTANATYDLALARLNPDGSLDTSFGSGGTLLLPIGSGSSAAYSVVVQPDGKIVVIGSGYNSANGTTDFALARLNPDGSLDTTFNGTATSTLGGTVSYAENGAPVTLDASVSIRDVDLVALASGVGDYGGASVTIARRGGADAEDLFSATGSLSFVAGGALLGNLPVGTVSNTNGTLAITFAAGTTQSEVDAVLSAIAYANGSDSPPASVLLDWTFSDGNTGAQGEGGALSASGTTTVDITAVNDAPVLVDPIADQRATEETAFSVQLATDAFVDADAGDTLTYAATLTGGANLPTWLAFDSSTRTFRGTPPAGSASTLSVTVSVTDTAGATASDTFDLVIAPAPGVTLTGTARAETLNGTARWDMLYGLAGNDTLNGLGGDDLLDGGEGADRLVGGSGDDTYVVDSSRDVIVEDAGNGTDSVRTGLVTYTLGVNLENLTYTGTAAFTGTGNALANSLTGGAGGDTLNGLGGDDRMTGGLGNDTYIVDAAGDTVIEAANGGVDLVRTALGSWTLAAQVENLTFTGTGAFTGSGNALGNVLLGGAGNDRLYGMEGADSLAGIAGNDMLEGGDGADVLNGGTGADTLTGGADADVFVYVTIGDTGLTGATRDLIVDFTSGVDRIDVSAIDAITRVRGEQAFVWRGALAIDGPGQLAYAYDPNTQTTVISGNVDTNVAPDFTITLVGNLTPTALDFNL